MAKKIAYSVFIDGQAAEGTLRDLYNEKRKINNQIKDMKIGSDQYVKATQKYKAIDGQLKQHRENLGKVTKSQKELVKESGLFAREITLLQGGLGKLKAGVTILTTSFHTLKGAIAATGIGALVIAIAALFSWLTKTKRGVEFMDRATAALGATFSVIVDRLSSMVDFFIKAFENPKQSIADLGEFVKQNLINRFTAIVDLLGIVGSAFSDLANGEFSNLKDRAADAGQAIIQMNTGLDPAQQKAIADGVRGVADEISNEAAAAYELEGALQALKDRERELRVEEAETRKEIRAKRLLREDETLSHQKRMDALQEAVDLELALNEKTLAAARERVRVTQEQIDLGESLEEDYDKLADAQVALANAEANSLKLQKTLAAELNTLRDEQLAEQHKREAETKKLIEERQKREEEFNKFIRTKKEELLQAQLSDDERELAQIDAKYAEMIEKAIGFEEQQRQLELLREEELAIKKEEQAAIKAEEDAAFMEEKQAFEDELLLMSLNSIDRELEETQRKYDELIAQAEAYGLDTTDIQAQLNKDIARINEEARQAELAAEADKYEREVEMARAKADSIFAIAQAGVDIASAAADIFGTETVEGAKLARTAALFQIGIDSGQAIAAAVAASAANPANAGTFGAAGIAQFAAMSATIFTNIAKAKKILDKPLPKAGGGKAPQLSPPKYAVGGHVNGFTGSGFGAPDSTGYRPAGIVHEGEWVAPKWMTTSPRFADTIRFLESHRENGYAKGGFVRFREKVRKNTEGQAMISELPEMAETLEKLVLVVDNLNTQISNGIRAKYDDGEVKNISKSQTEQANIANQLTL